MRKAPLRIGIDIRYLSHGLFGGVREYVAGLVPALVEAGGSETFVLYADTKAPLDIVPPPRATVRLLSWSGPWSSVRNDARLGAMMASDDIDVAFFPANQGTGPRAAATVVTVHDAMNLAPLREKLRSAHHARSVRSVTMTAYLDWQTRRAVARATTLVTVSEYSRRAVAEASGRALGDITAVHSAAPPRVRLGPDAVKAVRARFALPPRYLLADGLKNPGLLLAAAERLTATGVNVLPVFFARHPNVLPPLRAAVDQGRARLLVRPSREELAALYAGAAIFVFPSWLEGFGLPLLEAMQYGTPVVASDRGSIPEVGGDAALYVDAEDEAGLARVLGMLLANPHEADALRARGARRAAGFTWERTAEQTLRVLREAAARTRRGGA